MGAKVPQVSRLGHISEARATSPGKGPRACFSHPVAAIREDASDYHAASEATLCPHLEVQTLDRLALINPTRGQTQWKTHLSNSVVPCIWSYHTSFVACNSPGLYEWSRQNHNNAPFYLQSSCSLDNKFRGLPTYKAPTGKTKCYGIPIVMMLF